MYSKLALLACSFALIFATANVNSAQAATHGEKEWTFLVYLNGDNSLDNFGPTNINQMEQVGSTDKVNIVVQWASLEAKKTVRLLVKKDNDTANVTSPIVQDMGSVDMGDYRNLVEFVRWGVTNYPAKHYFINVWDHGSGWHSIQAQRARRAGHFNPTDISWDDNTGHSISTVQLGQAMSEAAQIIGHKVDVYGSDACLMAMAEVAGEMKDSVHVYAGSQEVEPGAGWPYQTFLADWNALSDMSPENVGKALVKEYTASYMGGVNGNSDVTFAAYDLNQFPVFANSIVELGKSMMKADANARKTITTAAKAAQTFTYDDYNDLQDFVDQLQKAGSGSQISRDTFDHVRAAMSQFVLANSVTTAYAKAHGVSIWLPHDSSTYSSYADLYKTLHFQADTDWMDAVHYVLQDSSSR